MESSTLRGLPLFEGLTDDVVDAWANRFQDQEMLAGTSLIREGDFAYKFFVVLGGDVEVQRGFQHAATLGTGDFFGEMGVMSGARRNARIVATTRCHVAWMMGWDFEAMLEEHPDVAQRIQAVVDERMATLPDDATD